MARITKNHLAPPSRWPLGLGLVALALAAILAYAPMSAAVRWLFVNELLPTAVGSIGIVATVWSVYIASKSLRMTAAAHRLGILEQRKANAIQRKSIEAQNNVTEASILDALVAMESKIADLKCQVALHASLAAHHGERESDPKAALLVAEHAFQVERLQKLAKKHGRIYKKRGKMYREIMDDLGEIEKDLGQ